MARLHLPAQRFTSDEQLAFADGLRYNPWHSLPDHKRLGNSNRACGARKHDSGCPVDSQAAM